MKNFKFYAIVWAVALALFNVATFAVSLPGGEKFTGSFWAGYALITLAFAGQLVCSYLAFKPEKIEKIFLKLPLITISYAGFIVSVIVGALCMAIPVLPAWIGIVIAFLILAFTVIALTQASAAGTLVGEIDDRIKVKTAFIKLLSADAEHAMAVAGTPELRAEAKKVYEAVRYSDPMSHDALLSLEGQIQNAFTAFESALKNGDAELSGTTAAELINLLDSRNKKCRVLK